MRTPRRSTKSCSVRISRRREGDNGSAARFRSRHAGERRARPSSRSSRTGSKCWYPSPCAPTMGWPEFARLGFGATLPTGAMPIGLEGDWLDRFGGLLGERGRFAERQLAVPTMSQRRAIRSACSSAHSICPTQSGACMTPSRRGHVACCLRFATPPYQTKSARDWSGWLQPGYRRGHGRRLSGAAAHVLSERHGLAGARPGHPPSRGRGVGCGNRGHGAC